MEILQNANTDLESMIHQQRLIRLGLFIKKKKKKKKERKKGTGKTEVRFSKQKMLLLAGEKKPYSSYHKMNRTRYNAVKLH